MNFRNLASMFMLAIGLATTTGCSTVTPGTVVLEVPVCSESAEQHVLTQGRYWPGLSACTNYYEIPSREQRAVWTASSDEGSLVDESITFAGKDGQKVNVDVGVGYVIGQTAPEIITMVKTFGYDVGATIHSRVRDSARNALNMCASHMSVDEIYGTGKEQLFKCAEEKVQAEYNPKGLIITRLTLNSEVRLPQQVQEAMTAATAATQNAQRIEREVASAEAEGKKKVATANAQATATIAAAEAEGKAVVIAAEAQADANKKLAASITPELLRLKALEIELAQAQRWNGALPAIQGSGSGMIIDLRTASSLTK